MAFDSAQAQSVLPRAELLILIAPGEGTAKWTAWTCDFFYDYVKIKAEYHA